MTDIEEVLAAEVYLANAERHDSRGRHLIEVLPCRSPLLP